MQDKKDKKEVVETKVVAETVETKKVITNKESKKDIKQEVNVVTSTVIVDMARQI